MTKRFWFNGMLLVAFAAVVMACPNKDNGNGSVNLSLNGTWIADDGYGLVFNNGDWQGLMESSPIAKGKYDLEGDTITMTTTDLHSNLVAAAAKEAMPDVPAIFVSGFLVALGINAGWHPGLTLIEKVVSGLADAEMMDEETITMVEDAMTEFGDELLAPQTLIYSISGNGRTLTLSGDGYFEGTFTRQ